MVHAVRVPATKMLADTLTAITSPRLTLGCLLLASTALSQGSAAAGSQRSTPPDGVSLKAPAQLNRLLISVPLL